MNSKIRFIIVAVIIMVFIQSCGTNEKTTQEVNIVSEISAISDWETNIDRSENIQGITSDQIRGFEVVNNSETVFSIAYEPNEYKSNFDYWNISVPYNSVVTANTEELYKLFDIITSMELVEALNIDVTNAKSSVFIAYSTNDEEVPNSSIKMLIGDTNENGDYYVNFEGNDKVYVANKTVIEYMLNINPINYILKIPAIVNIETIDSFNIIYNDKTYKLEKNGDSWEQDNEIVDDKYVSGLYGALLYTVITAQIPDDAKLDENRVPIITIQYFRNNEDASDVEIKYYDYDDENMSVVVNNNEFFLIDKTSFDEMINQVKTYLK